MSYNGWKNWETWNVALWLGNDEGLYREACRMARRANHGAPIDADAADTIVCELLPHGTPDFDTESPVKVRKQYNAVDWDEIAADLNEMADLEVEQ